MLLVIGPFVLAGDGHRLALAIVDDHTDLGRAAIAAVRRRATANDQRR
jgi:hypothetical protein